MNFNPSRLGSEPLFIGLGHYKRTGKDSFADFLIRALYRRRPTLRVMKTSFAWKLKQICFELYAWAGLREPEFYETIHGGELREVILPELGKSPRDIWIDFGTKAVRENVYERTWLDYLLKTKHEADVVIVPDVRFLNEAEAMQAMNATLVKVVRPGYGPGKNKPDRQLLGYTGWHNVIGDEGSMGSLELWASFYADWILDGRPVRRTAEQIQAALAVEKVEPWVEDDEPAVVPMVDERTVLFTEDTARAIFELYAGGAILSTESSEQAAKAVLDQLREQFPNVANDYAYMLRAAA